MAKIFKVFPVPDGVIDSYVIGMAAHAASIEGQHLKQQNMSLCGWKAESGYLEAVAKAARKIFLGLCVWLWRLFGSRQLIFKSLFCACMLAHQRKQVKKKIRSKGREQNSTKRLEVFALLRRYSTMTLQSSTSLSSQTNML